ncbi:alpha/beta hydrolase [Bryobacter aggregatus]|uniref:alpha/beta hydrolase n=1 Tax=Bryobacter aggregatus TaxID=360054 RepID=UPI0009B5C4D9|nr:alpha/beta fold hydrolase [Bryobacter aggregatus]
METQEEIVDGGLLRRHIRFEGVPAWLLLPPRIEAKRAAVLCLHQTTKIGKDEPAGLGGKANLHYARELALRGFVTLAPDYPNFGEYTFDPYANGFVSATMKGIVNHMRAVSLLSHLSYVDAKKIAVCGHSLGGHNSLFAAAFDKRIRAVITSCGFTSFAKYYGGNLKGWSHKGYMPRMAEKTPETMPFDFKDVLAEISPRPIFVNAPLHDANFDALGVDDAVRDSKHPGIQVEHPDCEHDFPPAVRQQAYAWLERRLT